MTTETPKLFGLNKTNRDFTKKETWGKNQFNSSFPASLCCYLASKNIDANYLSIQQSSLSNASLSVKEMFGISANDTDLYFAFEAQYTPYQKYIIGALPRTDLVIQMESSGNCLASFEIKLTALPDNTTCELNESDYGCEIVVRPDTIVYLACSIAACIGKRLGDFIPEITIEDWASASQVLPNIVSILDAIEQLSIALEGHQLPFLLQPIWKTKGKSPNLAEQCLDVFVWSNAGFSNFMSKIANNNSKANNITRQTRAVIWLFKMLKEIKDNGRFNHKDIIDDLSYNTRNDKAFASSGNITTEFMSCSRLESPIISKSEIKNIILGGGQTLLSPERRFDAIIYNSPELFLS